MAIELTPQKRSKTSLFTTITGIVAAFLILVFVGTYLYFYITNKGLIEKVNKIKEDSKELDKAIKTKEEELLVFQRRINDFSSLILEHKNIGKMFDFINKNTIPTVWFNEFEYDREEKGAFLVTGESSSFFLIEQQTIVFRNQELVEDARLAKVSIDEKDGLIEFSIRVVLKPEAFAFKEELAPEELPTEPTE
ncbi:hypothetical protein AMJ47_01735 [Parcubacteria bacterium DG_72]|nr:MAG: hypothetical protein AMJ47_01735 [Parcubacteria bacterium DG_72]